MRVPGGLRVPGLMMVRVARRGVLRSVQEIGNILAEQTNMVK
jgi:hypothetical protein